MPSSSIGLLGADLGDVLTGIRVRSVEADDHGVVTALAARGIEHQHLRQHGQARRAPPCHQLVGDVMSARPAQTNDAERATAWRRRHGDDGVVGSEHVTSVSPARSAGR